MEVVVGDEEYVGVRLDLVIEMVDLDHLVQQDLSL